MISQKFNTGLLHYNSINDTNIRIAKRTFQDELNTSKTPIPYNDRFSKENLQKMPEHKWMADVDMTLVTIDKYPTYQELYDELIENAYDINNDTIPMLKDRELKVISIDLETTGLSKVFKRVGGAIVADTRVVGICIGVSPYKSYYIPLRHNEQDGIKNLPLRYGREILNALEANCFTVYHHAQFDREIMQVALRAETGKDYADTMVLALHLGLKDQFFSIGLKHLSEELLYRKMVEINELMDSDFISFDRLCASMAYAYGCSDAANTYGLFCVFTGFNIGAGEPFEDLDQDFGYENPFKFMKIASDLDYKALDATRSMMRLGMPIDIQVAEKRLKTMIRRSLILSRKIYEIMPDDVSLTSPEQLGMWIGETLFKHYKEFYKDKTDNEKIIIDKFCTAIARFGMERKVKNVKAGEKVTYNANAQAFDGIMNNVYDTKWIPEDWQDKLYNVVNMLSNYASIKHELGLMATIVRFATNDDMGIARGVIDLRFNGADASGRWSNAGDSKKKSDKKGERINIYEGEKKPGSYIPGSTQVLGLNAQGLPSTAYYSVLTKAKKLKVIPDELKQEIEELNNEVEAVYTEMMNTI